MLTRDEFKKYMQLVVDTESVDRQINAMIHKNRNVFGDSDIWFFFEHCIAIVELVGKLMGDQYGTLDYWVFELECGKDSGIENTNLPEDDPYRKPDLSDLDKLYDYIVWESKNNEKKQEASKNAEEGQASGQED